MQIGTLEIKRGCLKLSMTRLRFGKLAKKAKSSFALPISILDVYLDLTYNKQLCRSNMVRISYAQLSSSYCGLMIGFPIYPSTAV
jgi:hypothetical protein